jgi:hypothetical protein
MGFNKKFFTTGGIVAASPSATPFDPLQNFETVTYTGNGGTQKITGYIRKGAAFNGSSSKIVVSDSSTIFDAAGGFSASVWVNRNTTANQTILNKEGGVSGSYGWSLRFTSGLGYSYDLYDTSNNQVTVSTGANSTTGNWEHIVISFNNSDNKIRIYLNNGSAVVSSALSASASSNTENFFIGARTTSGIVTDGKIDQVRTFNRAVSDSEVTTLYGETYASSTKSTTDIFSDGSGVALYELDEDSFSSNFEKGAVFNGSSSIIGIPTSTINVANPYSISMWLNIADVTQYKGFFVNVTSSRLTNQISVVLNSGKITIYSVVSNGNTNLDAITVTPQSAIVNNTWFNLVIVADRSATNKAKVFFNSVEGSYVYQSGVASTAAYSETRFGIADGQYFNGKIDQVRIYSSALGSSDITKLYNESSQIPTANLTAHYKLDGNALDSVGSNNGTETSITYAGGVYGGTDTNINYLGMAFQPDFVWIKSRNASCDHSLTDSVRGVQELLSSNTTAAEVNQSPNGLTSFDSNGFTVTDVSSGGASVNGAAGGSCSGTPPNYVAWCWYAPTSETNTNGDINSTIKKNVAAGFSIVSYNGATNATSDGSNNSGVGWNIGHGLSVAPSLIIIKKTNNPASWYVGADGITTNSWTTGNGQHLVLNESGGQSSPGGSTKIWNSAPTTTTFNVGGWDVVNRSGDSYIAYCFANIAGYQKVDKYTGNSGTNAITTGFQPRWVLMKNTANGYSWIMQDSTRGTSKFLYPNLSNSEPTSSTHITSFDSNGFTLGSNADVNYSGDTYIYLAIA